MLFLPGDQFLSAALQENPGLIDESLRQNVMLATPTSLVALLKAVAYGWKQTVLADNAAEIRRLGEDVYKRLAVFGEHLGKFGKSLGNSVDSFNKAVGSLEQQVTAGGAALSGARACASTASSSRSSTSTRWRARRGSRAQRTRTSPPMRRPLRPLEEPYRSRAVPPGSARYWSWLFAARESREPLLGIYALLAEWRAL